MPLSDHPLLNDPSLTALILAAAADGRADRQGLVARLNAILDRAHEPRPPESDLHPRLQALCADLLIAGLLARDGDGVVLTEEGRAARAAHPHGLDRADLMEWPAYSRHVHQQAGCTPSPGIGPHEGSDPAAYLSGVAARTAGIPATENPYPRDSVDHGAWDNGWEEADPA